MTDRSCLSNLVKVIEHGSCQSLAEALPRRAGALFHIDSAGAGAGSPAQSRLASGRASRAGLFR